MRDVCKLCLFYVYIIARLFYVYIIASSVSFTRDVRTLCLFYVYIIASSVSFTCDVRKFCLFYKWRAQIVYLLHMSLFFSTSHASTCAYASLCLFYVAFFIYRCLL